MDDSNALEALRLVSDWAKWLITIETGAIATIGAIVKGNDATLQQRGFATAAVLCFVASICSAAVLLLSLPEVAQTLRPGINIWMTSDSVLNSTFGLDTQTLATFESLFFAVGIICFA